VLVHAHVARGDLFWAGKVLYESRDAALACCPRCRGERLVAERPDAWTLGGSVLVLGGTLVAARRPRLPA
jgi:hypothetical protein